MNNNKKITDLFYDECIVESISNTELAVAVSESSEPCMEVEKRKVGIYCHMSIELETQLVTYENQMQFYDILVVTHPEWEVYKIYRDEDVAGKSINRRKDFLQMQEDAKDRKIDLIVTRELLSFGKNIMDTLLLVKELKKNGVEVYFVQENLWSFDCTYEYLLTIMAVIPPTEESKRIERIKAGQAAFFKTGGLYCRGNILGYDRVDGIYIINCKQTRTVRTIYDMYLDGKSIKKIKYELEKSGCLTSRGKTNWDIGSISRILNNPFYCGIISYSKQLIQNNLEQKKTSTFKEVDKTVVKGTHEAIVTETEYKKVQEMLKSRS